MRRKRRPQYCLQRRVGARQRAVRQARAGGDGRWAAGSRARPQAGGRARRPSACRAAPPGPPHAPVALVVRVLEAVQALRVLDDLQHLQGERGQLGGRGRRPGGRPSGRGGLRLHGRALWAPRASPMAWRAPDLAGRVGGGAGGGAWGAGRHRPSAASPNPAAPPPAALPPATSDARCRCPGQERGRCRRRPAPPRHPGPGRPRHGRASPSKQ